MNIQGLLSVSKRYIRDNAPSILAGVGISGTITTAYLAHKAGVQATRRLSEESPYLSTQEKFNKTWDLYIPPTLSGAITIGCIVAGNKVGSNRAAAAYSLLSVTERAFDEYKDKVIETVGKKKEQTIRDEIAQDRVNSNPPTVVFEGESGVLCCELYTGRYFKSDMEALRKAQNDINAELLGHMYCTMDDLYYILGLSETSNSGRLGWESDRLLAFEFSTVLAPDNKPCLAFEYNYVKVL